LAAWNHSGSIHSDYSATGTVTVTVSAPGTIAFGATMLDGAGRRFIVANHTFTAAGSANLAIVAQAPGAASNDPVGTTFTGELGFNVELSTNGASGPGNPVLNFATLPSWVAVNQWVTDKTRTGAVTNDVITAVDVA